jgi:FHS family L-fucose permease-like MFS transporter
MSTNNPAMGSRQSYAVPMTIIGVLFFIFGFITWVNGTLISYLKITCELSTELQSFLVATAFFIAYAVMALPSSAVLKKTGYKKGMSLGLAIMAVGAVLFIPAAQDRNYPLFLTALFIIGTGLALLQTASNPYASIIGPIESAATRISILGICNKVAGILAGLIFGYIALKDADGIEASLKTMDEATKNATLNELSSRVIGPYIVISIVLVVLAIGILFSPLPDLKEEEEDAVDATIEKGDLGSISLASSSKKIKKSVLEFPHLLLGVLAIFLYVGVEVMAGDTIISYGKLLGVELNTARYFSQATLAFMLLGYIIGILAIPKYMNQQTALKICALLGAAFTVGALLTTGMVSVFFIALLGLANSLMWPAIFPLAINGLGKFTKTGSALLVMGIAGGALIPLLYGAMIESGTASGIASGMLEEEARARSARISYWIMIPSYLYILYYSMKGYKAK